MPWIRRSDGQGTYAAVLAFVFLLATFLCSLRPVTQRPDESLSPASAPSHPLTSSYSATVPITPYFNDTQYLSSPDTSYHDVAPNLEEYRASLQSFILSNALPSEHTGQSLAALMAFTRPALALHPDFHTPAVPSKFWATSANPDLRTGLGASWASRHPLPVWQHHVFDDFALDSWAKQTLAGAGAKLNYLYRSWCAIGARWAMRADMFRYLALALEGGLYADSDTECLQPMESWGQTQMTKPIVFSGFTPQDAQHQAKQQKGETATEDAPSSLVESPPGLIVGIGYDASDGAVDASEHLKSWSTSPNARTKHPRPLLLAQHSVASVPYHPVMMDTLRRLDESVRHQLALQEQNSTLLQRIAGKLDKYTDWNLKVERADQFKLEEALYRSAERQSGSAHPGLTNDEATLQAIGQTVSEMTGAALFTDAVISYLKVRYGVSWRHLLGLAAPVRIGEVLILPKAGIGKGGFAEEPNAVSDGQAVVRHWATGAWKDPMPGRL